MSEDDEVEYEEASIDKRGFCSLCGERIQNCSDCTIELKPHDKVYCGNDGTHICKSCFEDRLWL